MVALYCITVASQLREVEMVIQAENANDAVITGLLYLRLVSLELVTGITIELCSATSSSALN